jgi:hypothetical protein
LPPSPFRQQNDQTAQPTHNAVPANGADAAARRKATRSAEAPRKFAPDDTAPRRLF